ncbi:MAG: peptidoglycan-binding domain-containing protein [Methylocystis sp.]
MKFSWLALFGALAASVGLASLTDVADAQIKCNNFGCYTRSPGPSYGGGSAARRGSATADRRAKSWRAAVRERQRATRALERERRAAAAAVARRAAAVPAAAASTGAGVPVAELDVNKVPTLSRDGIRRVQQVLKGRGFDPGPVNGVPGARMKDAVSGFQKRYGIAPTGDVDNQTLLALGEADLASQSNR